MNNVVAKQYDPASNHTQVEAMILAPKEAKQIKLQRQIKFAKLEVHIENGEPTRMVNIRESIQL